MENQMNNIQPPPTPESYYNFIRYGSLLIYLSLILGSIALIFVPFNVIHKSDGYETVLIVNQRLIRIWTGYSLLILIIFLIFAYILRKKTGKDYSHPIYRNHAWAVVIILCVLAFPINWMRGWLGKWVIIPLPAPANSFVTGTDGKRYHFLYEFALMGTQWAIASEKEWHWYWQKFDILAIEYMDRDAHAYLIRPANMTNSPKLNLYASDTGWVVFIADNTCTAAYDIKNNHGYGALPSQNPIIREISPFILIGPNTKMNPSDLKWLENRYKTFQPDYTENPNEKRLTEALSHPNSEVRNAAQILLAALRSNKNYQKPDGKSK